jgi:hypothetical protein
VSRSRKTTILALVALIGAAALVVSWRLLRPPRADDQTVSALEDDPDEEDAAAATEATAPEPREVNGRVLGPDDKPVVGAKLFLCRKDVIVPAPQAATKEDGTFAFTLDPNDVAKAVLATAPGHGLVWSSIPDRPLPALELRLPPDEPIRGRVINPEGQPVAGVSVSVVGASLPHHSEKTLDSWLTTIRDPASDESATRLGEWLRWSAGPVAPVTSDRDGRFEIHGVGRDRVVDLRFTGPAIATDQVNVITRKVERFTVHRKSLGTPYQVTYYGAEPILVAAPVPVTTGRVLDRVTGVPVPGTVHLVWARATKGDWMSFQVVADGDGKFTLPGLAQGRKEPAQVSVIPPDGSPYHRLQLTVPDGAAERASFDQKLTRGVPTTVKIIDKVTRKPVKAFLQYNVGLAATLP